MDALLPLLTFVVLSTITPGPNNLLLATSGMRFGIRATLPLMLGIQCGIYTLVLLCGFGLGQILLSQPDAIIGLKVFASAYLVYLGWKLIGLELTVNDTETNNKEKVRRPMTVLQASLFQFINPKAWMMVTSGLAIVVPVAPSVLVAGLYFCAMFATVGLLCNCAWLMTGYSLQDWLQNPARRRMISGILVALVAITIALFWLE